MEARYAADESTVWQKRLPADDYSAPAGRVVEVHGVEAGEVDGVAMTEVLGTGDESVSGGCLYAKRRSSSLALGAGFGIDDGVGIVTLTGYIWQGDGNRSSSGSGSSVSSAVSSFSSLEASFTDGNGVGGGNGTVRGNMSAGRGSAAAGEADSVAQDASPARAVAPLPSFGRQLQVIVPHSNVARAAHHQFQRGDGFEGPAAEAGGLGGSDGEMALHIIAGGGRGVLLHPSCASPSQASCFGTDHWQSLSFSQSGSPGTMSFQMSDPHAFQFTATAATESGHIAHSSEVSGGYIPSPRSHVDNASGGGASFRLLDSPISAPAACYGGDDSPMASFNSGHNRSGSLNARGGGGLSCLGGGLLGGYYGGTRPEQGRIGGCMDRESGCISGDDGERCVSADDVDREDSISFVAKRDSDGESDSDEASSVFSKRRKSLSQCYFGKSRSFSSLCDLNVPMHELAKPDRSLSTGSGRIRKLSRSMPAAHGARGMRGVVSGSDGFSRRVAGSPRFLHHSVAKAISEELTADTETQKDRFISGTLDAMTMRVSSAKIAPLPPLPSLPSSRNTVFMSCPPPTSMPRSMSVNQLS